VPPHHHTSHIINAKDSCSAPRTATTAPEPAGWAAARRSARPCWPRCRRGCRRRWWYPKRGWRRWWSRRCWVRCVF